MALIADSQWFIQLRSIPASNAPTLENFIPAANKAIDPAQLRLYVVKDDPRQTIGVIYGTYASAQEAYADLAKLPGWIRAGGAFARPFKALRAPSKKATASAVASGIAATN
jgi:MSHA biogenesis protein MshM